MASVGGMTYPKIAIIGPGLLGGSIALAMRKKQPGTAIAVWARRPEAADEVREKKIADLASTDLEAVVKNASVVIFCVPIGAMVPLAEKIAPLVSADTLITDVGSVKAPVVDALGRIFRGRARFIGSHPMAGSEQTGIDAARADLFENAACIVTPGKNSTPVDSDDAMKFWSLLGCRTSTLPPYVHDETVALVSHLPHLLAATLVNLVCEQNADSLNFCGNGFRDTTRVASGSPGMWTEIFKGNRGQVKKSVELMIEKLRQVMELLEDDAKMNRFLADAKNQRDRLKQGN
jgi:cyclohexadieny/prephenate dehydrogenase